MRQIIRRKKDTESLQLRLIKRDRSGKVSKQIYFEIRTGAHTISIVYEKKLAMWKIILPVCVGVVLLSAGFVFYLRVLQIRRIRRRKLEAEKTPQSANQMAQRRVEYRRNLLNFQKQFIKKRTVFFASCYNKAERMGNVWTHL